jgi:prolyl-tRNA editing enzyme YbaK/EbsC (Cys-tRNA(Pro) deacylase)
VKKSAASVQSALDAKGVACVVVELPASTRSAKDAAAAIGCTVAQIAKTIVFRKCESGEPFLVVASGVNRIDESLLAGLAGEPVEMATPDFVRIHTGFAIGGVPPCGHLRPIDTLLDRDLLELGEIWAAAGTSNAVFRLVPDDLRRITGGVAARVATD